MDEQRESLRQELEVIAGDSRLADEIETLRDMLIQGIRAGYWRHRYSPQERAQLYRKMGLTVQVDADGGISLDGRLLVSPTGFVGQDNIPPPSSRRTLPPPR